MAEGGLGGLLGNFAKLDDPNVLYGGLLSDEATQRAINWRGLMSAVGSLGQSAMPSRLPIPLGGALGIAAGAMGPGEDAVIKARTEAAQGLLYGAQGQQQLANIDLMKTVNRNLGGGPPPERLPGQIAAPAPAGGGGATTGAAPPAPIDTTLANDGSTRDYLIQASIARKLDPGHTLALVGTEGGHGQFKLGDGGSSGGPFQLHVDDPKNPGRGTSMGDQFFRDTGLNPLDPKNERATIDYSLDHVAKNGGRFDPNIWHGARNLPGQGAPPQQTARAPNPTLAPGAAPQGLLAVPVPSAAVGLGGVGIPAGPGPQAAADQAAVPPAALATDPRMVAMLEGMQRAGAGTPVGAVRTAGPGAGEPDLVMPPGAAGLVSRSLIPPPGPAAVSPPAAGPSVPVPAAPDAPAAPDRPPPPTPAQVKHVVDNVGTPPPPADPLGGINPAYVKWAQNMSLAFSLLHLDTPDNIKQAASLGMVGAKATIEEGAKQPYIIQQKQIQSQLDRERDAALQAAVERKDYNLNIMTTNREYGLRLFDAMQKAGGETMKITLNGAEYELPRQQALALTQQYLGLPQTSLVPNAPLPLPTIPAPSSGSGVTPPSGNAPPPSSGLLGPQPAAPAPGATQAPAFTVGQSPGQRSEQEAVGTQLGAEYKDVTADYENAFKVKPQLLSIQNALQTFSTPGSTAQARLDAGKSLLGVLQPLGLIKPDSELAQWVASGEIINKSGNQLGFALSRSLGAREAAQIVQQAIATNPGLMTTLEGNKQLIGLINGALDRDIAKREFYDQWWPDHQQSHRGAAIAFNRQNPVEIMISRNIPYDISKLPSEDAYKKLPVGTTLTAPGKGTWQKPPEGPNG